MVERETQVAHRPDGDRVLSDHRPFLHLADTQNGNLGLADNGGAEEAARAAVVRDRERAALNFFRVQPLGPCTIGQVGHFLCERGQAFLLGIPHNRDEQPIVERDCDADVNVLFEDDSLLPPRRVEDRKVLDCAGDGVDHKWQIG